MFELYVEMHLLSNENDCMRQPCSGLRGNRGILADQALLQERWAFRPAIAKMPCTVVRGIPALQTDIPCDMGSKRQNAESSDFTRVSSDSFTNLACVFAVMVTTEPWPLRNRGRLQREL